MFDLRTHPEATDELSDQLVYLRERTLWQASKFADSYQTALVRIRKHPSRHPFTWKEFRRYNIPSTSHAIIYRVRQREIFIIAVMHERRHPDYWKHRIDDDRP